MPKFTTRPVVIEATQFWKLGDHPAVIANLKSSTGYSIQTLEHTEANFHEVTPGDYIITGVEGENYACKPGVFSKTYRAGDASKGIFFIKINPFLLADYYKVGHVFDFPEGTEEGYANVTARGSRMQGVDHMVVFGVQYFLMTYLIQCFNENFFDRPFDEVMAEYQDFLANTAGDLPSYEHVAYIHRLGYLPLEIKSLPEGSLVPMRVPFMTIRSTDKVCAWLGNFIETITSCSIWQPCTSATIAHEYRKLLDRWARITGMPPEFVPWQGHDFSMRGMSSLESAVTSDMGHLLSFTGSDTMPAIYAHTVYYGANIAEVGGSVWATEHNVMCAGSKENELETYRRMITSHTRPEVLEKGFIMPKPTGIKSIVSDTWDLWNVIVNILPQLKEEIMNREPNAWGLAKTVIRPDSGDPVEIVCGVEIEEFHGSTSLKDVVASIRENVVDRLRDETPHGECGDDRVKRLFKHDGQVYEVTVSIEWNRHDKQFYYIDGSSVSEPKEVVLTPAQKGVIELLWEIFGGTLTSTGHRLLDSHIGCIYGDSITLTRADQICARLAAKGFASQCVLGIGSFTYQYNTRDTFMLAMKGTNVVINGVPIPTFKDPITDDGTKKSAIGYLRVRLENGDYVLDENVTREKEQQGELTTRFLNGDLFNMTNLIEMRDRLTAARAKSLA